MKDEILKLRSEGLSYRDIEKTLGCSRSTIAYHCSDEQKQKTKERKTKHRQEHPINRKIETFKAKKTLKCRCEKFQIRNHSEGKNKTLSMKDITMTFYKEDVFDKFGENLSCYLTGRELDWNNGSTYVFDHKIPVSKGGDNTLDNLGICHPDVNYAKSIMTVDEFIQLCKDVLIHNGYKIEKLIPDNALGVQVDC